MIYVTPPAGYSWEGKLCLLMRKNARDRITIKTSQLPCVGVWMVIVMLRLSELNSGFVKVF